MAGVLTAEQRAAFERDGYVIVRSLFDAEETALLRTAMETDPAIRDHFYDRRDSEGAATKMATWNHPGDSVYGLAARSARIVDTMEELLGGEVYHYHSKLTAKNPHEGGAWEWHQDYGYWYHNGCLFPLMASAMIALDRTTPENGCLQVLQGSHHMGRIDHGLLGLRAGRRRPAPGRGGAQAPAPGLPSRWSRATRCCFTATCCTGRTRTGPTIAAGP